MPNKCPCGNSDVQELKEEHQPENPQKRYAVCLPDGHQLVGPPGGPWKNRPEDAERPIKTVSEPSSDISGYRKGDKIFAETIDTETAAKGQITLLLGDRITFEDAVGNSHVTTPELVIQHEEHGGPRFFPPND